MSAPHKDDSYRLPHYGRDGVMPDWLGGWTPPQIPNLPHPAPSPIPVVPGFPWWVDPWTPQPSSPGPLQPEMPPEPSAPDSLLRRIPIGNADGLPGLLQAVMLQDGVQPSTDGLNPRGIWQQVWASMAENR